MTDDFLRLDPELMQDQLFILDLHNANREYHFCDSLTLRKFVISQLEEATYYLSEQVPTGKRYEGHPSSRPRAQREDPRLQYLAAGSPNQFAQRLDSSNIEDEDVSYAVAGYFRGQKTYDTLSSALAEIAHVIRTDQRYRPFESLTEKIYGTGSQPESSRSIRMVQDGLAAQSANEDAAEKSPARQFVNRFLQQPSVAAFRVAKKLLVVEPEATAGSWSGKQDRRKAIAAKQEASDSNTSDGQGQPSAAKPRHLKAVR
ncbi:MAG: hypothetical protein A2580_17960 [Hydrogenophilales bacterium RIFOXYD1_FULL_62_11]|nr:MAG: hypothetical protein A2580_17960 [Hydrogenophilales bacterium RIFOXYD1_FULL_62_11]